MSTAWHVILLRAVLLVAVLGIPFTAFFILALRYFYLLGALWGDGGALASIMWHNGWALAFPAISGGGSSLGTHMNLVFWLTSSLSWLLPLGKVQFFALFTGLVQALMALPVYWLLADTQEKRPAYLAGAALLAILFAFNGIVLAAARNPHFELLIIASGMMFIAALARGRLLIAIVFFILCLITREDAGFDLFLLLAVGAVALRLQGGQFVTLRLLIIFGAVALLYSIAVFILQHLLFPGGGALQRVYLGTPPFHNVTPSLLATRLAFYVIYRPYILVPPYIAVALTIRWRNPHFIAGFVACLPWGGLNLLADSPYAGTLSNYYAFPFIFALFWPLAAWRLEGRSDVLQDKRYLGGFVAMLAASFLGLAGQQNPQNIDLPESFFPAPSWSAQARTDEAIRAFGQDPALGRVAVDGGIVALDPNHYTTDQLVWAEPEPLPDTVIFFPQGQGTSIALRLAARAGLHNFFQVPGTALRVATNRRLDMRSLDLIPWTPPPQ